jgi:hypothetical protein
MKIVSKSGRKQQEVDILIDLDEVEEDLEPKGLEPQVETLQEKFEFYKEDWVIQVARSLGCVATVDPLSRCLTITHRGRLLARVSEETAQTCSDLIVDHLRVTINYFIKTGTFHEAHGT